MRLLLLRHAKSDWSGTLGDHDRPLAPRGKKAALVIGAYIRAHGYEPALVLCSTALRTKETLELMLPSFSARPDIDYDRSLYLAEWPQLLERIRGLKANSPVLLVGHNPGLEQLAIALALKPQSPAEQARLQRLAQKFPAGALAVLDFAVADWADTKPGRGQLVDFVKPKDLRGAKADDE